MIAHRPQRLSRSTPLAALLATATGCQEPPPSRAEASATATATATATASSDAGAASCAERVDAERKLMSGPFDDKCAQDSDCVASWGVTECGAACALALSKAGDVAQQEAIAKANRGPCKDFKKQGCARPQPSCVVRDPVCRDGRCVNPGL